MSKGNQGQEEPGSTRVKRTKNMWELGGYQEIWGIGGFGVRRLRNRKHEGIRRVGAWGDENRIIY